jgi:ADP-ribose pyrophosphatase YjhB (NUDIX family)
MRVPGSEILESEWSAPRLTLVVGDPDLNAAGVVDRTAVRAVIRRGDELLMVHSPVAGDHKFPGGGVEAGESLVDALVREVREECGRSLTTVNGVRLVVDELRPGYEPGWVLRMTSVYVDCAVGEVEHAQQLDDYEADLAFRAGGVAPQEALRINEAVVRAGGSQPWVAREIAVLRHLLSDGGGTASA